MAKNVNKSVEDISDKARDIDLPGIINRVFNEYHRNKHIKNGGGRYFEREFITQEVLNENDSYLEKLIIKEIEKIIDDK